MTRSYPSILEHPQNTVLTRASVQGWGEAGFRMHGLDRGALTP
jgi:hypothetical protein